MYVRIYMYVRMHICTRTYAYCTYVSISICQGKFITEVFDKWDNFNFNIVNYPYMCSNIPAKPTYGVYISQLIRISRICDKFDVVLLKDIDYLLIG